MDSDDSLTIVKKIVKELESKWDYHESDIIEIFEQRLLGENI